ncbi:MAG: D-alanyl-D-alanine carboxypeptidase, partial [Gemmatimonadales bacterium]
MTHRLLGTLVTASLLAAVPGSAALAQSLSDREQATLDAWFQRTVSHTAGGEWGIAIGSMDGRVLWSASPELELIPASTAKVFTTGYSRSRVGPESRFTTRVIGDGQLDAAGRWLGTWALELGGDPTLDRSGRA